MIILKTYSCSILNLRKQKQKYVFWHMRTAKAQISLRILGFWSGHFTIRLQNHWTLSNVSVECKCPDETLHARDISRYVHYVHCMHVRRHIFAWHGPCQKKRKEIQKKVREKSRECHNHKPQPFPDTKRKRKLTNPNKHKSNKRTKSTKISSLFPKRGNRNTKRTEKHKNKMTHCKTYNKSPRRINHKATKSKTNTGTTALERSVE